MGEREHAKLTRREALTAAARALQERSAARPAPLEELVNSIEFEDQARLALKDSDFAAIAGSDRSIFDRYTFRPRMNVPTLDMDLSVTLLGHTLFTPIIAGPISHQRQYHRDGERAMMSGAATAKTATIVSNLASFSLSEIASFASELAMPCWLAIYAGANAPAEARAAVSEGAEALFVNIGARYDIARRQAIRVSENDIDWRVVDAIRNAVDVPIVLKGVLSTSTAERAAERDIDGIVVSNFGGLLGGPTSAPIPELRAIVDAVGDALPVLVDGSFRRATDILVALTLGARAVLLGRPIIWALSSYGADGVATLLRMLQTDVARCFAMLGASSPSALRRSHIRIHNRPE